MGVWSYYFSLREENLANFKKKLAASKMRGSEKENSIRTPFGLPTSALSVHAYS